MKDKIYGYLRKAFRKIDGISKNYKRVLLVVISCLFVLGTFAWFATSDSVKNNFKSGNPQFDVALKDTFDPLQEVELNTEVNKIVAAKNTEDLDAFVRIMIFPVAIKKGEPFEISVGDQLELIGMDEDQWMRGEDDYFYYIHKLAPGQTTPNLFEKVKIRIPDNEKDEYKDVKFDIVAKTEAINIKKFDYRVSWWGDENAPTGSPKLLVIDEKLKGLAN